LNLPKGSAVPNKTKVGEITHEQLEKIAKIHDVNTFLTQCRTNRR